MNMYCRVQHRSAHNLLHNKRWVIKSHQLHAKLLKRRLQQAQRCSVSRQTTVTSHLCSAAAQAHVTHTWAQNITHTHSHSRPHTNTQRCRRLSERKTLSCSAGRTNTANSKKSIDLSFHSKILNWDLLNSKKSPLVLFQTIREHNVAWERGRGSDER